MGTDRDTPAHVDHDEVFFIVRHTQILGGAASGGPLREGVETALPLEGRVARVSSQRPELVDHHRVGNKGRSAGAAADLVGQRGAEARGMLTPFSAPQVADHLGVYSVDAAGDGLGQSAAAGNGQTPLQVDPLFFYETPNGVEAELVLIDHAVELGQLLLRMADLLGGQTIQAAIDGQLRGSRAGIKDDHQVAFVFRVHQFSLVAQPPSAVQILGSTIHPQPGAAVPQFISARFPPIPRKVLSCRVLSRNYRCGRS